MEYKKHLDKAYAKLCEQFGDLEYKKIQIQKQQDEVKRKIDLLNENHNMFAMIESQIVTEINK